MSASDDIPPSDDFPPPIKQSIDKLSNKDDLIRYLDHLSASHTHHLSDLTHELQERLLLQGFNENDFFHLHEFLAVEFENGLLRANNENLTKKHVKLLEKHL